MPGPLDGIRVLEIAQEIQGPYAGAFLADMGADVMKVELPRTGDLSRYMRVSHFAGPDAPHADFGWYFLAMNRGKRSIELDLKNPGAREAVYRLVEGVDVLLTNYRPGVLDRLGFGWETLRERNPRLIYAAGSSWGPTGPWQTRPSRDTLAQATGGLMAKTGPADGAPQPCGAMLADHSGAITLTLGVLAALYARERTGRGQTVDASIFGTVLALQAFELSFTAISGMETPRAGRGHQFLKGPWGAFRTRDGWICLAGVDDRRLERFCRIMGIESHLDEPEIADTVERQYRGERIQALLDERFPKRTTREWLDELEAADILAAPVLDYRALLANEQARANGYVTEMHHPQVGTVPVVGDPVRLGDTPLDPTRPPPELGQHTEEILLEAGLSWEQIGELRASGAI